MIEKAPPHHPLLAYAIQEAIDDLDALLKIVLSDTYAYNLTTVLGRTSLQVENLRRWTPKIIAGIREAYQRPELEACATDTAAQSLLARIQDRSDPDGYGCRVWRGSVQGAHKYALEGGTPVISYRGQTVPARRTLWQLKYPAGHPNHLLSDERLRKNPECRVGSRCLNLDHWHKGVPEKVVRDDRAAARAFQADEARGFQRELQAAGFSARPPTPLNSRRCRNGHLIQSTSKDCPVCQQTQVSRRMAKQNQSRRLGQMILGNPSPATRRAMEAASNHPEPLRAADAPLSPPLAAALGHALDALQPPKELTLEDAIAQITSPKPSLAELLAQQVPSSELRTQFAGSKPAPLPWPAGLDPADDPDEKLDEATILAILSGKQIPN